MTDIVTFVKLHSCLGIHHTGIPSDDAAALIHIGAAHDLRMARREADCHCLQDSRLNYIEQHANSLGLDSDKLENARVNASKASPMNDTLDLCARYANGKTLDDMVSHCCFQLGLAASARLQCLHHVLSPTHDTHMLLVRLSATVTASYAGMPACLLVCRLNMALPVNAGLQVAAILTYVCSKHRCQSCAPW